MTPQEIFATLDIDESALKVFRSATDLLALLQT
jgi:hypothetical protein